MNRARLAWSVALAVCALAAAVGIATLWTSSVDDVAPSELRWRFAALSLACMGAFVVIYAVCWWMLVDALDAKGARFGACVRLFLMSWPGRYVPASLPHYGGRLAAAPAVGLTRGAVAASLIYENLFAIAVSGSLSLALLLLAYRDALHGSFWIVGACATALIALVALQPPVVRTAVRVASRRVRRLAVLEDHILGARDVLRIGAAYSAGTLAAGAAYYFALRAVTGDDAPLLLAVAAYNLAGIAGMLAIAVPGGLGVREGAVVGLMGAAVSPAAALSAAIVARLAGVIADVALFACAAVAAAAHRLSAPAPVPAAPDSKVRAA